MPHRDTIFRYHRAVSDQGITYYPRQNGGAWKADSDGFEYELAIATHVISNNVTTCMETWFQEFMDV